MGDSSDAEGKRAMRFHAIAMHFTYTHETYIELKFTS